MPACQHCQSDAALDFAISMAFQPIVDIEKNSVFAYEALVRGPQAEPAGVVLARVTPENCYRFDQSCRQRAIALAARLGIACRLSINFMPNAVYHPATCIRATLEAATHHQFPVSQIIFEYTEGENLVDSTHIASIVRHYQEIGFSTAIDDFGSGYANLNRLAQMPVDLIKLDMDLIRNIHQDRRRLSIVQAMVRLCDDLATTPIAEGIELIEEYQALRDLGIRLYQGYLFARPAFEQLPDITWPAS